MLDGLGKGCKWATKEIAQFAEAKANSQTRAGQIVEERRVGSANAGVE